MEDLLLADFWDHILSREPKRIRKAYDNLPPEDQQAVYDHLLKMVTEDDWHPEQVVSAQAALAEIEVDND